MKQVILRPIFWVLICLIIPHGFAWAASLPADSVPQISTAKPNTPPATIVGEQTQVPSGMHPKEVTKESARPSNSTYSDKKVFLIISLIPAALFVFFLLIVKNVLQRNNWSLAEALSESETTTGPNGTPVFARSASRFMAFIGFFAIILWIVGLSIPTLYRMICVGEVPDLSNVSTFLLAQVGIFAPYIVNKLAGTLTSKTTP